MTTLLYNFILLQVLDGVTTWLAISSGGGQEANPIGQWMFNNLGLVPSLFTGKLIVCGFVGVLAYSKPLSTKPRIFVLLLLNLFYAWVVIQNFHYIHWTELFL